MELGASTRTRRQSIRKCEEQYLRVVNVDRIHKFIFVQRVKADERMHSAVSYFRKAIAICQAVGTVLFASHPSSPAMRKPLFPSWFIDTRRIVRCLPDVAARWGNCGTAQQAVSHNKKTKIVYTKKKAVRARRRVCLWFVPS
jgi:hypothetical protein